MPPTPRDVAERFQRTPDSEETPSPPVVGAGDLCGSIHTLPGGREVHCQYRRNAHRRHRAMGPVMRGGKLVAYWVEEWTS